MIIGTHPHCRHNRPPFAIYAYIQFCNTLLFLVVMAVGLLSLLYPLSAQAYQRSFTNLGFESPVIANTAPCRVYISNTRVPGWLTTHPFAAEQSSGANCTISTTGSGQIIEMWKGPRDITGGSATTNRLPAREGSQLVELNADAVSELSQNICLVNGEPVKWRFSHNGRNTTNDTMVFRANNQKIMTASTSITGNGNVASCDSGTCAVTSQVMTQDGITRWADYSGNFNYTGASGQTVIGFQSTSGSSTNGNFLDNIQVELKPIVEFSSAAYSVPENNSTLTPIQVVVAGVVPAGGLPLTFNVTDGTTLIGTDYTINGGTANTFSMTVPAGDYGQGTPLLVNVPVNVINDNVTESNEYFTVSLQPGTAYHLMSTSTCGVSGNGIATYTIIDDDQPTNMDMAMVKTQRNVTTGGSFQSTPLNLTTGNRIQYQLIASNKGSNAVDISNKATFSDVIPANINALGIISVTGAGGATSCTASLSGNNISGQFSGPSGTTCTVIVEGTASTIGSISNTATVSVPVGNNEIFNADNSSTVQASIGFASLVLNKSTNGGTGTFGYSLGNTTQSSGSVTTVTPGVKAQVDGDTSISGTQAFIVSAAAAITINENSVPTGWILSGASCTNNSGNTVGSLSGSTYTIPAASVSLGESFNCNFVNTKLPTVKVQKITTGGTDTFSFSSTNLSGTISNITTSSAGVAAPASPVALAVTTISSNVTITETPATNYALKSASCVDNNSAVTGNIGNFGTLSGNTLTIPFSYLIVGGGDISCTFNNSKQRTLTVIKSLLPSTDAGQFVMNANGVNGTAGGNGATASTLVVVGSTASFAESAASGTTTSNYSSSYSCNTSPVITGNSMSGTLSMPDANVACIFSNTRKSASLRLVKQWQNGKTNDAVTISSSGFINNASTGNSISTGNNTSTSPAVTVYAGETGSIGETFSVGNASNYNATLSCSGNTIALTGNTLTISPADTTIICTYSNSRITQQLSLAKQWQNAGNSHSMSVTTTGGSNNPTLNSTSTGNNSTAGTALTVYAGDSVTLPAETFTGGANAAMYNSTVACSGGTTLASGIVGRSVTISNNTTATVCTYLNTRKSASLTLKKTWVNAIDGDAATVSSTGFGNNASSGNSIATGNNTTKGSSVIVYAGESGAITEAFSHGTASNYNALLSCTGNTTPLSNNTLSINPADTAIICTYTNSRNQSVQISGRVFNDNSGTTGIASAAYNGIQNNGESGIAGSTVRLTNCANVQIATTSSNSAGDYSFSVSSSQLPATFCIVQTNLAGYSSVSGSASYNRSNDTISLNNTGLSSYANNNFGDALLQLVLTEDGEHTVMPGGVTDYTHRLRANSVMAVNQFIISSSQQPANSSDQIWQSLVYRDTNCNGILDSGETLFKPTSSSPLTLLPGQEVCLVQRVNTPANASAGSQHIGRLSASYVVTLMDSSQLTGLSNVRQDTTLVGSASLTMSKQVRVVASCPSTNADVNPFSVSNQASNSSYLEYEITYLNNSTRNLVDVVIKDSVPLGTSFISMACYITPMTSCISSHSGDTLKWQTTGALTAGGQGKIRFCVRVN